MKVYIFLQGVQILHKNPRKIVTASNLWAQILKKLCNCPRAGQKVTDTETGSRCVSEERGRWYFVRRAKFPTS